MQYLHKQKILAAVAVPQLLARDQDCRSMEQILRVETHIQLHAHGTRQLPAPRSRPTTTPRSRCSNASNTQGNGGGTDASINYSIDRHGLLPWFRPAPIPSVLLSSPTTNQFLAGSHQIHDERMSCLGTVASHSGEHVHGVDPGG